MKTKSCLLALGLCLFFFSACQKEEVNLDTTNENRITVNNDKVSSILRESCQDYDLCDCRARITNIVGTPGPQSSLDAGPPFGSPLPSDCNLFETDPQLNVWYDFQVIQGEQWFVGYHTPNATGEVSYTMNVQCPDNSFTATGPTTGSVEVVSNCPDCDCRMTITDVVTQGPENTTWIAYSGGLFELIGEVADVPQTMTFGHVGGTILDLNFDAFINGQYPLTTISYTLECGDTEQSTSVTVGSAGGGPQPTTVIDVAVDEECDFSIPVECNCTVSVDNVPWFSGDPNAVWTLDDPNPPAIDLTGTLQQVPQSDGFMATSGEGFSITAKMPVEGKAAPTPTAAMLQVTVDCGGAMTDTKLYSIGTSNPDGHTINYTLDTDCNVTGSFD